MNENRHQNVMEKKCWQCQGKLCGKVSKSYGFWWKL